MRPPEHDSQGAPSHPFSAEGEEPVVGGPTQPQVTPGAGDPSTQRGFTPRLLLVLFGAFVVAYLVTLIVVGTTVRWQLGVIWGFAVGIVAAVMAALVTTAREDGRIERQAQRVESGRGRRR